VPAGPRVIDQIAATIAHVFYRIDVVGSVPETGALLLLPNHPNALLDPALVMASAGRPVRFLAKSTLFNGPLRPLLAAAGAIPVYRRQDASETSRNTETFAAVDAALAKGEAVCVFPEGISHSSGMLEPLRTGAARMALSAVSAGADLQLVAVGINLEQKTTFRSRATVAYGPPFRVDLAAAASASSPPASVPTDRSLPPDAARRLTGQLASHMRALLIEADPRADAQLVDRVNRLYRSERGTAAALATDLARRRTIADAIHTLRRERPEWYESAIVQLRRYDDRLRRFGLDDDALDWEVSVPAAWRFMVREIPRGLMLLPLAGAAVLVFSVPYSLTALAARVTDDMDVTATAKVVAGVVVYSAWIALITSVAGWLGGALAAIGTLLLLPVLAVSGLFAIERESSAWRTARAWLSLRGARPTTRAALRRRRAELAGVLEAVNDWMAVRGEDNAAGGS
jgi:1-acyl-sn-glycerol-3-phosphate acyltransferase